jgi:hypothetical protein
MSCGCELWIATKLIEFTKYLPENKQNCQKHETELLYSSVPENISEVKAERNVKKQE